MNRAAGNLNLVSNDTTRSHLVNTSEKDSLDKESKVLWPMAGKP